VADPTGVGDAFFAALLDGHLSGAEPLVAAAAASRHAASYLRARALPLSAKGVMP
jgi:sugar/nucleoside kinase (ribokinase family)